MDKKIKKIIFIVIATLASLISTIIGVLNGTSQITEDTAPLGGTENKAYFIASTLK